MPQTQEERSLFSQLFAKWKIRLSNKWQFMKSGKKPEIISFDWDEIFPMENGKILLKWQVENVHYISINHGIGEVTGRNQILVWLPEGAKSFKLNAWGGMKKVTQMVEINVAEFAFSKVPQLDLKLTHPVFKLPNVELNRWEENKKKRIFHKRTAGVKSDLPVNPPLPPSPKELERIKKELSGHEKVKELQVYQTQLQNLMNKDLLDGLVPD